MFPLRVYCSRASRTTFQDNLFPLLFKGSSSLTRSHWNDGGNGLKVAASSNRELVQGHSKGATTSLCRITSARHAACRRAQAGGIVRCFSAIALPGKRVSPSIGTRTCQIKVNISTVCNTVCLVHQLLSRCCRRAPRRRSIILLQPCTMRRKTVKQVIVALLRW